MICQIRQGNYSYENASSIFDKETNIIDAGGASQDESVLMGKERDLPDLLSQSLFGTDVFNTG